MAFARASIKFILYIVVENYSCIIVAILVTKLEWNNISCPTITYQNISLQSNYPTIKGVVTLFAS